ncbi:MAG: hypothetical protein ACYDCC_05650 [Actinomycetota bacterium]
MSSTNGSNGHIDELSTRIAKVKARGKLPMDKLLLLGSSILAVLGIALILFGWYGASHTPYVFEQIPYLISGGVLGLAFAVVGALGYFSYWLTRQVQETRRQGEESRVALARLEAALISHNGVASKETLVATKRGTMVHLKSCPVVSNRSDLRVIPSGAEGFEPCKICEPYAVV